MVRAAPRSTTTKRRPAPSKVARRSERSGRCGLGVRVPLLHPLREFLRRHVFHVRAQRPLVAEGIANGAHAVAPELVGHRLLHRRTGGHRAREGRVAVRPVDDEARGAAAALVRPEVAHVGPFVREHEDGVADARLGVADPLGAVGPRHRQAVELPCAEGVRIERQRPRGVLHDQVGGDRVVTLGHGTGHGRTLRSLRNRTRTVRRETLGPGDRGFPVAARTCGMAESRLLAARRAPRCSSMADETGHLPRRPARILKAAQWSLQGLQAAWLHESSFRLEVYLFVVFGPLGYWLGQTPVERVLLIGSCLLVIAMELLNSAVEAVIERYGPEFHELAGRAKDMGSAAVFVLMLNVLLTWGLIVVPRWF